LDAYLQIAESILKIERRPLSARAILAAAYRHGLVPMHLHGNTQHKTLGARISEDIITLHDDSLFFRTAPGRFFLREFLTDVTDPRGKQAAGCHPPAIPRANAGASIGGVPSRPPTHRHDRHRYPA
jgi:HB1, ASXL, restriction endonuclease HTH domain